MICLIIMSQVVQIRENFFIWVIRFSYINTEPAIYHQDKVSNANIAWKDG